MPEKIKPIYIDHPNLPSDIILAVIGLVNKSSDEVTRQKIEKSKINLGRQLISEVIADSILAQDNAIYFLKKMGNRMQL
jgi:hypothetical protein